MLVKCLGLFNLSNVPLRFRKRSKRNEKNIALYRNNVNDKRKPITVRQKPNRHY